MLQELSAVKNIRRTAEAKGISAQWELVEADKALAWLERASPNRRLRPLLVKRYVEMMRKGEWIDYHPQPLVFRKGELIDGQHRLNALIEAPLEAHMLVVSYSTNDRRIASTIDRGAARTPADSLSIAVGHRISPLVGASIKAFLLGTSGIPRISDGALIAGYRDYNKPIVEVCSRFVKMQGCGYRRAHVVAACIRGALYYPMDRLERFIEVLETGMSLNEKESAIIALRNFTLTLRGHGGRSVDVELYLKAEKAIQDYMEGNVVRRCLAASKELFPLDVELKGQ